MLRMLGHTIETAVRSIWPAEFADGRRSDFGKVLDEKAARSTNELERQFARHAQHLYKQYRVPAEHHTAGFSVSYIQVVYFLYGIRVLNELGERLKKASEGDKSRI